MDYFEYRNQELWAENLAVDKLAEKWGTPLYIYSKRTLLRHIDNLKQAFTSYPTLLAYAIKANSNLTILKQIFGAGLGGDLVSGGELQRALRAGGDPQKMVFSGVGKSFDEIKLGLSENILAFNVESRFELEMITQAAQDLGITARVNLRMNPNISVDTNPKITTGMYDNKFGIPETEVIELANHILHSPHVDLIGLACHIGSQMTNLAPLAEAAQRVAQLSKDFMAMGHNLKVCDMGGGLGIRYHHEAPPSLEQYAETLIKAISPTGLQLIIEPGRVLMGNVGILVTQVIGIKATPAKTFAVVDGAMNDLIRPAMYDSFHEIIPTKLTAEPSDTYDIVGPICESSDFFGKGREIQKLQAGDYLCIRGVGAYGSTMSSNYNSRPRACEIMVDADTVQTVRKREQLAELWQHEEQIS